VDRLDLSEDTSCMRIVATSLGPETGRAIAEGARAILRRAAPVEPTDVTIDILKDIRQEMRETKEEIRATRTYLRADIHELREELSHRIDETNKRVDETNTRLVHSEIRLATAVTDLAGTVREMRDEFRAARELGPRVERCEREIADIKRRLPEA
jgi:hypothetical protein